MDLPQLVGVQVPNFAGAIGNAMDDRYKIGLEQARSQRLNEQADIERQRFDLERQKNALSVNNAAASKAAVTNALRNSVVPLPGEAAGPYLPSVQRATNALALQGRTPEANTLSNFLEQQAKQKQAENTAEQGGIKTSADKLALENSTLQQAQKAADTVSSPEELLALNAAIHSPNSPLRDMFDRMGIDADTSQAKLQEAIQTQGFSGARAMFAQGAAAATAAHSKELQDQATLAGTQATTANTVQTGQQNAVKFNAPVPKEVNLGNRIAIIDSNPQSPTFNQELSSMDMGITPKESTPSTLAKLISERDSLPLDDPRRDIYAAMIKKETTASGQTINVGDQTSQFTKSLGEAQAKKVVESQTAAKGAANQLDTIAEGEKLLNSGMYSGTGATFQTSVGQALQKLGFTAKDDAASNAQAYGAIMGKQVGEMVKQFGSGTSISDGDRIYAERMAAGDINLDEQAMRKILRINKEAALKLIRSHNKTVAGVKSDLPLTVPVPTSAAPPAEAIAVLKSKKNDPEVKKQFDQWYGEGAAEDVLGQ